MGTSQLLLLLLLLLLVLLMVVLVGLVEGAVALPIGMVVTPCRRGSG